MKNQSSFYSSKSVPSGMAFLSEVKLNFKKHWTTVFMVPNGFTLDQSDKSNLWLESTTCSPFLHNSQSTYERSVMQTCFPEGRACGEIVSWKSAWKSNSKLGWHWTSCDVEKLTSSQMKSKSLGCMGRHPVLMTKAHKWDPPISLFSQAHVSADHFPLFMALSSHS